MVENVSPDNVHAALAWLVSLLEIRGIPYQIVGGLAAQAYGATRPLVDVDLYLPFSRLPEVLSEMQPYLRREPLPHRSDSWDLVYLALSYAGVWIEIGDSERNPCFFNRREGCWEAQEIDFTASQRALLYGVELYVMPEAELIRYKVKLDREVDHMDILEMERRTLT